MSLSHIGAGIGGSSVFFTQELDGLCAPSKSSKKMSGKQGDIGALFVFFFFGAYFAMLSLLQAIRIGVAALLGTRRSRFLGDFEKW